MKTFEWIVNFIFMLVLFFMAWHISTLEHRIHALEWQHDNPKKLVLHSARIDTLTTNMVIVDGVVKLRNR